MPAGKNTAAQALLIAAVMLSFSLAAQTVVEILGGGVRGRVLDSGRSPVVGANITALPDDGRRPGPPTVTGKDGEFSLALDPGFYTFEIVAPGFREVWETVVLRKPETESRDFVLQPASSHVRKRKK